MIVSNIIQIVLSVSLLLILLFLARFAYDYETIVNFQNDSRLRKEIIVFDGIMDFSTTQMAFNTYNKKLLSFKDLTPSINQNGGAEYSYNFWMYVNQKALTTVSSTDIVILMRGSKLKIPYINNTNCEVQNKGSHILVKNPLIRMKSDGSAMVIEYNTITNPDAYRENGTSAINCSSGSWYDKNKGLLGIYNMNDYIFNKKWFMFTLVLKEISPENDILYKNKTSCKVYINGINVLDRIVESPYNGAYGSAAMKHNRAPLYVNPGDLFSATGNDRGNAFETNGNESAMQMANLSYFNYSLNELDIQQLFVKNFTRLPASGPIDDGIGYIEDKYAIAPVSDSGNNLPHAF